MKILQAHKFYYNRGGAESAYFAVSDLLERHGHDVIPFSMHDSRNLPSAYSRYFVRHVELRDSSAGTLEKLSAAGRVLYSREAERNLDRLIRDVRPDIAHLHNIYHQLSPSILRSLARHGIPTVMTLHDYKLICPAYTLYSRGSVCERCSGHRYYNVVRRACVKGSRLKSAICAVEAYFHAATGIYRNNVKLFVAPSNFVARKAIEFGVDPARIVTLPNFVDTSAFEVSPHSDDYFLYAGRLEPVKGLGTLLRSVNASGAIAAHQLLIAGEGEARGELEAYCREHSLGSVRFLGQLSQDALAPVVARARFVVLPSEWYENAPMSILEAAARGKAAIVSDMGGLPEIVRHDETGLVVPAGDVDALRRAVEALLADPERARTMGIEARAFVEERFSPESHYLGLMNVYERAGAMSVPPVAVMAG